MPFIRNTPSLSRRRLLNIITVTVVGGAVSSAVHPGVKPVQADLNEDGPADPVGTDTDHDGRVD